MVILKILAAWTLLSFLVAPLIGKFLGTCTTELPPNKYSEPRE